MKHQLENMPMLLLIGGLPATGKTWLARFLAEKLGAVHINSDKVRAALNLRGQYDKRSKQTVYSNMLEQARAALREGSLVIVDSTFYKKSLRRAWGNLAEREGVPCHFIELTIPAEIAFQRLQKKREDSEADWEVYKKLKKEWEPFDIPHLTLDAHELSLQEMALEAKIFLTKKNDPGANS